MEQKTARLTLLIDPNKKDAFERLCASQDRTASQVVRQLIRDYLAQHGVEFVASGSVDPEPARNASARPAPGAKPESAPTAKARSPRRKA